MRKKLLLASLLFAGGLFTMNAQTTVWSDNFDDLDVSDWTLIDADGDGYNWSAVQIVDQNGNPATAAPTPVLRSASWNSAVGPLTPDNWAISPAIDLSAASGTIKLKWEVMAIDAAYDEEEYTVYVGTEATIAHLSASSTTFFENLAGVNVLSSRSLDISSFAGETIYVAFRHHGTTNIFTMELDNVEVEAETLSINNALAGSFSVYPNPVKDILNISNSIGAEINSVTVTDINGRTVKQVAVNGVESQINIADLNAGVYFVNINSNQGSLTKKIVKK